MEVSNCLASFAAGLRFEDLPAKAVERAKAHLLDTLGVCLGGSNTEHVRQVVSVAEGMACSGPCTVIGHGLRTSPAEAAFANAVMGHSIDFDDGHKFIHPGCAVVPVALAIGEQRGVSGNALIRALAAGYDVSVRVSLAAGPPHREKGFHPTATCNVFGAAAAAGNLLELSDDQVAAAFAIASSQAGGLSQYRANGSPIKHLHAGLAARAGLLSALLAGAGYVGAPEPLEGEFGFLNLYADGGEPEFLTDNLGSRFMIAETDIKPYPCCRQTHAPLDLVLRAIRDHDVEASRIEAITLHTYKYIVEKPWLITAEPPGSTLSAMLNIPFCLATGFLNGRVELAHFDSERLGDQETIALARRVTIVEDPQMTENWPRERAARLEIRLADGRNVSLFAPNPRGGEDAPLSFAEITEKFKGLALPVLGSGADQLIERVAELESVKDVTALAEGLAVPNHGAGRPVAQVSP